MKKIPAIKTSFIIEEFGFLFLKREVAEFGVVTTVKEYEVTDAVFAVSFGG
mgnify:CR=1